MKALKKKKRKQNKQSGKKKKRKKINKMRVKLSTRFFLSCIVVCVCASGSVWWCVESVCVCIW